MEWERSLLIVKRRTVKQEIQDNQGGAHLPKGVGGEVPDSVHRTLNKFSPHFWHRFYLLDAQVLGALLGSVLFLSWPIQVAKVSLYLPGIIKANHSGLVFVAYG